MVTAVAERFERFDPTGVAATLVDAPAPPARGGTDRRRRQRSPSLPGRLRRPAARDVPEDQVIVHEVLGGPTAQRGWRGGARGERLDDDRRRYYGEPSLWRVLAAYNGISDPPACRRRGPCASRRSRDPEAVMTMRSRCGSPTAGRAGRRRQPLRARQTARLAGSVSPPGPVRADAVRADLRRSTGPAGRRGGASRRRRSVVRLAAGGDPPLFEGEVTAVEHVYEPDRGRRAAGPRLRPAPSPAQAPDRSRPSRHDPARAWRASGGRRRPPGRGGGGGPTLAAPGPASPVGPAAAAGGDGERPLPVRARRGTLHLLSLDGPRRAAPGAGRRRLLEARIEANGDAIAPLASRPRGWDASRRRGRWRARPTRRGSAADRRGRRRRTRSADRASGSWSTRPRRPRARNAPAAQAELDRAGPTRSSFRGVAARRSRGCDRVRRGHRRRRRPVRRPLRR